MVSRQVMISNVLGLHARAAAKFVHHAGEFRSAVKVTRGTQTVDGKSILGLLLLAAARGVTLEISAEGEDELPAVTALVDLVARGFDDP